jgi:hypothetical protein
MYEGIFASIKIRLAFLAAFTLLYWIRRASMEVGGSVDPPDSTVNLTKATHERGHDLRLECHQATELWKPS